MEEKKKLSTAEILARARAQKAAAAGEVPAEAASPAPVAEAAASAEASAAEAPAVKPAAPAVGGAPKSTKDILAAARAQAAAKAAGGAPAAEVPAAASKPAAGGAKSTKDILAAARAQAAAKAAGGDVAAAESPAAPKAAAAKPAAKPSAGGTPSVQEMLKAVREGKSAEVAAPVAEKPVVTAKIPVKPPAPGKAPAAKGKVESGPRRNFLLAILAAPFALAWTLLSITGLAAVLGAARFMFPNAIVEPPSKFKVGPPGEYPNGTVSNKWKAMFGIWIVNADFQGKSLIYALSTVCTHLGCTPSWLDGEQKFKCPCHGSGFYITGINFEGPAPRPLERYAIRVAEDGMLEVDKSQKFQQEIGQWDDPKSFVEIA